MKKQKSYRDAGNHFRETQGKKLGIPPNYQTSSEVARKDVIDHRMKTMVIVFFWIAFGICLANGYQTYDQPISVVGWTFCAFVCIVLACMFTYMQIQDWPERPGKHSYTLYRAWSKTRRKVVKAEKMADKLISEKDLQGLKHFAHRLDGVARALSHEVRRHETEGRESSRKRARAKISWVIELGKELGYEIKLADKFVTLVH